MTRTFFRSCLSSAALLLSVFVCSPSAMAQLGIDSDYNNSIGGQAQTQTHAPNPNMTQANTTQANGWSDFGYVQAQQNGVHIPGTLQAPLYRNSLGTTSTYTGNSGQFLRGVSAALGSSLPQTQMGLQAIAGGYSPQVTGGSGVSIAGYSQVAPPRDPDNMPPGMVRSGDSFYMPIYDNTGSKKYAGLPPTNTCEIVDLNVAQ